MKTGQRSPPERALSEPLRAALLREARRPVCQELIAKGAGISGRTLKHYLTQGRRGLEPYATFLVEFSQVQQKAWKLHLDRITKASKGGDWRASAWVLERTMPDHFGSERKLVGELQAANAQLAQANQQLLTLCQSAGLLTPRPDAPAVDLPTLSPAPASALPAPDPAHQAAPADEPNLPVFDPPAAP